MKKIVIINFDMEYIDTARVIYNSLQPILYSFFGNKAPHITIDDIEENINKDINSLLSSLSNKYGINLCHNEIIKMLELQCIDYFSFRGILSDGVQEFLQDCASYQCEVHMLTNKPYTAVEKCVKTFTPFLIKKIHKYKNESDVNAIIKKIKEETNVCEEDILIISQNNFTNNSIETFQYSKKYCGDFIVSNMTQLTNILEDKPLNHPSISCQLAATIDRDYIDCFLSKIKLICDKDYHISTRKNAKIVISLNKIKTECSQNNIQSMNGSLILDELISPFINFQEEIRKIKEETKCELSISVRINLSSSKVNPSISPSMKLIQFLSNTSSLIDYDLFII